MSNIDLNLIHISANGRNVNGRNVKYDGKAQDKCDLSYLIHKAALLSSKKVGFPLWFDIYWSTATKAELVDYLKYFIS